MFKRQPISYVRNIVGLIGEAGTGKNFVAEQVFASYGFFPWAFAWPLKMQVIGREQASYYETMVSKPPEIRTLLQLEGTENGRGVYGDNLWVNTTLAWLETLSDAWDIQDFVITDVRFANEAQLIRDLGGKVYRISAPDRSAASGLNATQRAHASETELNTIEPDAVIINDINTSLEDLHTQVVDLLVRDHLWHD